MVDRVRERSWRRVPGSAPVGRSVAGAPVGRSGTPVLAGEGDHGAGGVGGLLLELQRRYGNRCVQGVVGDAGRGARARPAGRPPLLQAKLVVGALGDPFERDADRVARWVAAGPSRAEAAPAPAVDAESGRVKGVGGAEADPWVARAVSGSRGGGRAIPEPVRAPIERALGADLGAVRLHTDASADQLNRALGSSAFTTGQHVYFRRGAYLPASPRGRELLAHEATHVVQQQGSGTADGVVQRNRPEEFKTYQKAKDFNAYSKAHLDKQKNDPLGDHVAQPFGQTERDNIYATNERGHGGKLTSDSDGRELTRLDSSVVPHVDHRFPKSLGGTNSYANASVISAEENIRKGNKLLLSEEPVIALAPYRKLKDPPQGVMKGRDFSAEQKEKIYEANSKHYGDGSIHSDSDKSKLERSDSSELPHIDHVTPKSNYGTNYYFNAMLIAADENIQKGGVKEEIGFARENPYDEFELSLTLPQFIQRRNTPRRQQLRMEIETVEKRAVEEESEEERHYRQQEYKKRKQKRKRSKSKAVSEGPPKKKRKKGIPLPARKVGGARAKGPRKRKRPGSDD
jgi:5-methylcytosine-specific restriction endonuclease McrA